MQYPGVSMLLLLNITSLLGLVQFPSTTIHSASVLTLLLALVPLVPLVTVIKSTNEKLKQVVHFPVRMMA